MCFKLGGLIDINCAAGNNEISHLVTRERDRDMHSYIADTLMRDVNLIERKAWLI